EGVDLAGNLHAHFEDARGNPALDFTSPDELQVDRTPTYVSGTLTGKTTWTPAGSPYIVTDDVVLDAKSTLTIGPGTVVVFRGYTSLFVDGQFSAVGTAKKPITIYGDGGALRVDQATGKLTYSEADETYVTGPRLEYVDMRNTQITFNQDQPHAVGAYI